MILGCGKDNGTTGSGTNAAACVDESGNSYKTVQIGNQIWMAENLRTTKFQNGDTLPNIYSIWNAGTPSAFCNPSNTQNSLIGKYYNYKAINDSRKLAPKGWRIPTYEDYNTLFTYLGGKNNQSVYKIVAKQEWNIASKDSITNSTNFTLYPSGVKQAGRSYTDYEPTSSLLGTPDKFFRIYFTSSKFVFSTSSSSGDYGGYCIRCIKE